MRMKIKALSFVVEVISKTDVFSDPGRTVIIRNVNGQVLEVGPYDALSEIMDGVFGQIQSADPSNCMSAEKQS